MTTFITYSVIHGSSAWHKASETWAFFHSKAEDQKHHDIIRNTSGRVKKRQDIENDSQEAFSICQGNFENSLKSSCQRSTLHDFELWGN